MEAKSAKRQEDLLQEESNQLLDEMKVILLLSNM
jgi:hypothetical protein